MVSPRLAKAKHARALPPSAWDTATSGTYVDRSAPRPIAAVVLVIALLMVCIPFAGMLWARTDSTSENRDLAQPPSLTLEDGSPNWNLLPDAGAYFEDHFAYRNQLVAANAHLRATLGVSPTDQVVVGTQGWLYYGGALPDYLGQSAMSDRALRNAAHNVSLMQRYAQAHDAQFVFTVAPNKCTLYPEHMPYYYLRATEPTNAERLEPLLKEAGVNYVDLFELFENEKKNAESDGQNGNARVLYLKLDTHWDNRGALLATQALLEACERKPLSLTPEEAFSRDDFVGDLENMLHPVGARTEENWYFEGYNDAGDFAGATWSYKQGQAVTDATVSTVSNAKATGNALVLRDSFGNSLLPFFASEFEHALFSKMVPYDVTLTKKAQADVVVVERAERHLPFLAEAAPLMPSPSANASLAKNVAPASETAQSGEASELATLDVSRDGPYLVLAGTLDPRISSDDCQIAVEVRTPDGDSKLYDAFWISTHSEASGNSMADTAGAADAADETAADEIRDSDYGYRVNLLGKNDDFKGAEARILVISDGVALCAKDFTGIIQR